MANIDKKFWVYELCENYEIKPEVFENYKIKGKFFDDAQYFFDLMGTAAHPSFRNTTIPKDQQGNINSFSCVNSRIDKNTIKILTYLLPYTKIVSIKFCSNNFDLKNFEVLIEDIINKQNNIYYISIEFNDVFINKGVKYIREQFLNDYPIEKERLDALKKLEEEKEKEKPKTKKKEKNVVEEKKEEPLTPEEYYRRNECETFIKENEIIKKLFIQTKLEGICLRGNKLGDDFIIELFNCLSLSDNDTHIKSLNLFYNNLTSKCIDSFCDMILKNKIIEEINFGKNFLNDDDIQKIKENTGKYPLNPEETENYKNLIKERDAAIAKNAKNKRDKKGEVPVPKVDDLVLEGEQYYLVKNYNLKFLNFMKNNITDKSYDNVIFMLQYNKNLNLSFDDNIFTDEHNNNFNEKRGGQFGERVFLAKH